MRDGRGSLAGNIVGQVVRLLGYLADKTPLQPSTHPLLASPLVAGTDT